MKIFRKKGFTLVEIMIVVAIIGIIIAIAVPAFLRARENARGRACQENLSKIDGAKEQYALEKRLTNNAPAPDMTDLAGDNTKYIKRIPVCPGGGSYDVLPIGTDPTCSVGVVTNFVDHVLNPVSDDAY
jgi:prepilin-type N-terminal cleavage/methylation domain-containing protein